MGLEGSCSDESIEHEHVASWQHARDKRAQERRKGGDWIQIPSEGEYAFKNDFSKFGKDEALYFFFGGIPVVRADELKPEPWDASGTIASYSAGSQIAEYREFKRRQGRERQGPKAESQVVIVLGPPAPPSDIAPPRDELHLEPINPMIYKKLLRMVRDETSVYSCWGAGAKDADAKEGDKGRGQWKKVPVATKVKISEGMLPAELLDRDDEIEGCRANEQVVVVNSSYEMARATINSHPALARALAKLLANGRKDEVRDLMVRSLPRVVKTFEKVTGRKVVGASIHWDSDLPHWNLWHTGLEKVIFKKGKGADRVRYRRTAMNMNSSGPGLRAWRRSQQAFERLGKGTCLPTMTDLNKAKNKAMQDQGRLPGDWTINDAADAVLEELLVEGGHKDVVDEGFAEFVTNEKNRYAKGLAGKVSRMKKEVLASQIQSLQAIVDQRGVELVELKAVARVDGVVRKLVAEFLLKLTTKPLVLAAMEKIPVVRHFFQKLAGLLKIDLKFSSPKIPEVLVEFATPVLEKVVSPDMTEFVSPVLEEVVSVDQEEVGKPVGSSDSNGKKDQDIKPMEM